MKPVSNWLALAIIKVHATNAYFSKRLSGRFLYVQNEGWWSLCGGGGFLLL